MTTDTPAAESPGEPEKKKDSSGCLGCFGILVVIAIIGGIASSCDGSNSSGDGKASSASASNNVVADTAEPLADPATAVRDWYSQGGEALITAISTDLTSISGSAAAGDADFSSIAATCASLRDDVADAQAAGPIPDDATQDHWTAALGDFSAAAADCITGASEYDSDLITQSGQELDAGGTELTLAGSRVGELAGN